MNTEKTQKYDPCRPFKKGDRVAPKFWNGRPPVASEERANSEFLPENKIYTVLADERNSIAFIDYHGKRAFIPVNHLELVTPVEELEPYILEEETAFADDEPYDIIHIYYNYNGGRDKVRTFYENGPESWNATKAAAEAECARLNAEYLQSTINN